MVTQYAVYNVQLYSSTPQVLKMPQEANSLSVDTWPPVLCVHPSVPWYQQSRLPLVSSHSPKNCEITVIHVGYMKLFYSAE